MKDYANRGATSRHTSGPSTLYTMITLLGIAGFAGLLYYLKQTQTPSVVAVNAKAQVNKIIKQASATKSEKPRFDFYTMLPKLVGETSHSVPTEVSTEKASNSPYYLQLGAFKKVKEAEALRAQLILSGYDAKISVTTLKHGTLNRVQVGPFATKHLALATRKTLKNQGQQSLLIRN